MRTWCWNISYNPSRPSNIASGSYSWCIALCVTIVAGWPLRPEVAPTYRQIFILPPLGRWVWIYIIVPITGKHTIEATVSEKLIRKWFTLWLNIIKISFANKIGSIGPKITKLWQFLYGNKEILENLAFGQIGQILKISNWGHGPNFWPIDPILFL